MILQALLFIYRKLQSADVSDAVECQCISAHDRNSGNSDVCDQRGADFRPSASVTAAFSAPRFCKERKKPCGASSELPVLLAVSSADPAAEQIELLYPVSRYRICQYSVAVRYDDETAAVTLPDGGGGKYAGRLPVYFKCPGSDR